MRPKPSPEKVLDLNLKYNEDESSSDDEFIESAPVEKIKNEKEDLDQKEFDLPLRASSNISFKQKQFDNDVVECEAVKKETDDVNQVLDEGLNYIHESTTKSEIIKQEEVHIKHEENNEDSINEKNYDSLGPFQSETIQQEEFYLKSKEYEMGKLNKKIHQCSECPYKASQKSNLNSHMETHKDLIFKCSKCSYETSRSANLKRHLVKHDTNIQWLYCFECSYKTHLRDLIRSHVLKHRVSSFKCSDCPYETKRKYLFRIHQVKHESIDKWHSCLSCPYKSYDRRSFQKHSRRCSIDPNNPEQIKVYKCTECSYESGFKNNVKRHQLIHERSSWFQCSDCSYKTPDKSNLNKHQVRHQEEDAEGWQNCSKCYYKAANKSILRRHEVTHQIRRRVYIRTKFSDLNAPNTTAQRST